ncbi:MAG: hypothetical protein QM728_05170 [Gordonia sp. (in: high G+C Gram-positive bacteria)]|uniref:hypothetical protein n=1 Tax=Gordonia sp. (in: high G+C Gram-positive bacteria) TaxID=84139 RepID=UPI0039E7126A
MISTGWMLPACVLALLGCLRYAWTTATGHSRPNLVTWGIWATVPTLAFAAQVSDGVGLPAALTLMAGLGPAVVVATALATRRFYARCTRLDQVCAALAAAALVGWLTVGSPVTAILLSIAADALALVPTAVKAWRDPGSEDAGFFVAIAAAATITLFTLSRWSIASSAFALYQLAACVVLAAVIVLRGRSGRVRSFSGGNRPGR